MSQQGRAEWSWGLPALACIAMGATVYWRATKKVQTTGGTPRDCAGPVDGVLGCIGNTPLVRINSLSDALGCEVLGKAEFMNPGGSVKDRVAKQIVSEAMRDGQLKRGGLITEGTAGSTGVSLAMVALNRRDSAGAGVVRVRPVSIAHPEHMVNQARVAAAADPGGFFADQFENLANYRAHLGTGREILRQCSKVDAFVCGAGTGGTIAGISTVLKEAHPGVHIALVDPPGSSLYNKVTRGVLYTRVESEGKRLKNPFDTVTEGVGLNRLTRNFAAASIDTAVTCSDQEAVDMAQHLLHADGLWVGSSSAVNCVGAVKTARLLGPGHTIVTILCDGGARHMSKFHNTAYLEEQGLEVRPADTFAVSEALCPGQPCAGDC